MRGVLTIVYGILKLFPMKNNKVVFCSRQGSNIPVDFVMLADELKSRRQDARCVFICCQLQKTPFSFIMFGIDTLRSMYHMSTSEVCILDTYWPAASLLKHKRSLTIIQIWHAIGKIKRSGKASLGSISGRDAGTARLMKMHENYDYIIAGSQAWAPFYCESFGCSYDVLRFYGLPRIDHMLTTAEHNRQRFFEMYPGYADKPVILYAPTFRRNMGYKWEKILDFANCEDFRLIVKLHPLMKNEKMKLHGRIREFDEWSTIDLIAAADYVITDYSATALEAAVLRKKICFWLYDYDEYIANNGLNIDIFREMPGCAYRDLDELMKFIGSEGYDIGVVDAFRKKYLPENLGHATEKIVDLIENSMV